MCHGHPRPPLRLAEAAAQDGATPRGTRASLTVAGRGGPSRPATRPSTAGAQKERRGRSRPSSRAGNAYLVRAMAKISPFKFLQEVRAEAQKVTWPTRKETTITTIMVFVMVVIASIFFLLADQVMRLAVSFLFGING